MIIALFHLQMMSILYFTYSNVCSPTRSSVSPSLESRPFTSAFTLGWGRGKATELKWKQSRQQLKSYRLHEFKSKTEGGNLHYLKGKDVFVSLAPGSFCYYILPVVFT